METDARSCEVDARLVYNARMNTAVDQIASVRIELADTDPLIWREVEVPTSASL